LSSVSRSVSADSPSLRSKSIINCSTLASISPSVSFFSLLQLHHMSTTSFSVYSRYIASAFQQRFLKSVNIVSSKTSLVLLQFLTFAHISSIGLRLNCTRGQFYYCMSVNIKNMVIFYMYSCPFYLFNDVIQDSFSH
jgi:hypothetical protein